VQSFDVFDLLFFMDSLLMNFNFLLLVFLWSKSFASDGKPKFPQATLLMMAGGLELPDGQSKERVSKEVHFMMPNATR